jgi:hypothetical protein
VGAIPIGPKPFDNQPPKDHMVPCRTAYESAVLQGIVPHMGFGRLIRVRAHRRDPQATIYVVAEPEVDKAIGILKTALARPFDDYEDLGRVTDSLLNALSLQPGTFTRT